MSDRRHIAVFLCVLLFLGGAFAVGVAGVGYGQLILPRDGGQYLFSAHYLSRHLSLWPYPQLELVSDSSVYPYGIDHVFLHWAFERDLTIATLLRLLGPGPWIQLYFVGSVLLTALGLWLILGREVSPPRAALAALAVSFCNFYSIRKYPVHMPHSCVHWTVLGIALDAVIVRRFHDDRPLSARLLLARAATLLLSLGLELGYVAGFSLASLTLTLLWILAASLLSSWRRGKGIGEVLGRAPAVLVSTCRQHPRQVVALAALCAAAAWVYLPLCGEIVGHAARYPLQGADERAQWESPARLLLPFLPGLNPEQVVLGAENRGEPWGFRFSPGLSFVLAAVAALACAGKRSLLASGPFLLLLVLCVFFDPVRFPTLRVFPWLIHARVPGQATSIFPVLLATIALGLPPVASLRPAVRVGVLLIGGLFAVETATAYRLLTHGRALPSLETVLTPDRELWSLVSAVRATPGEAVFTWPFSIAHDTGTLGVFQKRLGVIEQLAAFHGKKGVGGFFGRVDPSMIEPVQRAGWPELFAAAEGRPPRMGRDLCEQEWTFLRDFYTANDFCGVLLFTDLIAPETVEGFHLRFGPPSTSAVILLDPTGPGRTEFIPKPVALRRSVDRQKGLTVRLPVSPCSTPSRAGAGRDRDGGRGARADGDRAATVSRP